MQTLASECYCSCDFSFEFDLKPGKSRLLMIFWHGIFWLQISAWNSGLKNQARNLGLKNRPEFQARNFGLKSYFGSQMNLSLNKGYFEHLLLKVLRAVVLVWWLAKVYNLITKLVHPLESWPSIHTDPRFVSLVTNQYDFFHGFLSYSKSCICSHTESN